MDCNGINYIVVLYYEKIPDILEEKLYVAYKAIKIYALVDLHYDKLNCSWRSKRMRKGLPVRRKGRILSKHSYKQVFDINNLVVTRPESSNYKVVFPDHSLVLVALVH